MSFGAPYWFGALALLPALAFLFVMNEQRRRKLLHRIVAPRLAADLARSSSPERRRLRFGFLLLGIAAIITSLAQPRYGYTLEQSKRTGRDVFIAIDTSKSMLSTDVAPDRLARSKLAAQDLIAQLQGDRVGVLAFAGSAFLQTPLTIDYNAALDAVNDLDTDTIPRGGTNIAEVINEAAKAFGKGESDERALVLFTDGEELTEDGVAAAREQAGNFRIFTVGVGTAQGSLIPLGGEEGGFAKDPGGQIVKSKLDETRLNEIAAATGGFYTHLQNGSTDMNKIVRDGLGKMKEHEIDARTSRRPIERYQWPLAAGLGLIFASMFISERRREGKSRLKVENRMAKAVLALFATLAGLHSANAGLPANQGIDLYNEKKYQESYDSFNRQLSRNPQSPALEFDSGAAAYKSGEFDKAIDAFGRAITSSEPGVREKAEYNLGNALYMRGAKQEEKETKLKDWNNALQHYDEALKINSQNADAKYNRELVAKLIEQLKQPPPQQQQQPKQDDKKDQKNEDQKDQDQKNSEQSSQQNQQNSGEGKNQQPDKKNSGKEKPQDSKEGGNSQNSQQEQQQKPQDQNGQASKPQQQQNQQPGQQQDSKGSGTQPQPTPGQSPGENQAGSKPDQNQNSGQQGNQSQTGRSPHPTPSTEEPDKKFSGTIQAQPSTQPPGGNSQTAGQEEPYVPGQERQMTPTEAMRVLEAEKDEEAKGVLNEHKSSAPVLRDW